VKKKRTSLFAKSLNVDKEIKGRSPIFLFYLGMQIYHGGNPGECEKFIEPKDIEGKTFEGLIESLAIWWNESRGLRVKTNQLLDSESLKLYRIMKERTVDTRKKYKLKVKLTPAEAPVIDTTFSTDCAKFMNKIFKGYGKLTSEPECKAKKWETLKLVAEKLDWSSKRDQADPEELCSPEIKAALEYEVKGYCERSSIFLKQVAELTIGGTISCVLPQKKIFEKYLGDGKTARYDICLAELERDKEYLDGNFIRLKCMPDSDCSYSPEQFETAMFVARVWRNYAFYNDQITPLRTFYIRSLVPFLDLTKYSNDFSSLSERLSPDMLRKLSMLLRLAPFLSYYSVILAILLPIIFLR
jgi:hypothetical protein